VAVLKRIAPIFAVRDVPASLAYYERLGFKTREYEGGGYGFIARDRVEIHLGSVPADGPEGVAVTAYIWVDDADEIADSWRQAGADVRSPQDTPWGQHEGVLIDPDGNMIRFGSPVARTAPN
jgi:uncharacterized glyoxalase superfamily protein PhnB